MRYSLHIAYDGTAYSGWQRQPNAITVQQKVEEALSALFGAPVEVVGCGRTDAGVHATHFVLHFDVPSKPEVELVFRMNQMLPPDIAVKRMEWVDDAFHARFGARSRAYEYRIDLDKNPFGPNRSLLLWQRPDLDLLNQSAAVLLQYQDFAAFARTGSDTRTTLCDVMEARWFMRDGQLVFYVKANRFLRNMVRALVGTMLEVGMGKRSIAEWREVIEQKDRSKAGKSAAAWGLYLIEVNY